MARLAPQLSWGCLVFLFVKQTIMWQRYPLFFIACIITGFLVHKWKAHGILSEALYVMGPTAMWYDFNEQLHHVGCKPCWVDIYNGLLKISQSSLGIAGKALVLVQKNTSHSLWCWLSHLPVQSQKRNEQTSTQKKAAATAEAVIIFFSPFQLKVCST